MDTSYFLLFTESRKMNVKGPVECVWEMGDAYKILVEKYGGKKPPGILRCGWKNMPNVKTDFKKLYVRVLTGFNWHMIESSVSLCFNESLGYRRLVFP
jgi:hypothetical protein